MRTDALKLSNLHISQQVIDVVGRMGGHTYSRMRDHLDIKTLSKGEWVRPESPNEVPA